MQVGYAGATCRDQTKRSYNQDQSSVILAATSLPVQAGGASGSEYCINTTDAGIRQDRAIQ